MTRAPPSVLLPHWHYRDTALALTGVVKDLAPCGLGAGEGAGDVDRADCGEPPVANPLWHLGYPDGVCCGGNNCL
jgi:hypothetical protein